MSTSIAHRRSKFRKLHESGCFVLPNPWDAGSAKLLTRMGFQALATSSSAAAWTMGRPDYALGLDDILAHLRTMVEATDLPINADFESGFTEDLEQLAGTVTAAIGTGIAGLSIEDRRSDREGFYDIRAAAERVRAVRRAIDASGEDVLLVARADVLLEDRSTIKDATDRLVAYAEAGADCLYAPGLRSAADVAATVRAVAPRPLNVLVQSPWTTLDEMRDIGVRRISVGGSLAMAGWSAVIEAGKQLAAGSFTHLAGGEARTFLEDAFSLAGKTRRSLKSSM